MEYVLTSCLIIPQVTLIFDIDLNVQISIIVVIIVLWIIRAKL